MRAGEFTPVDLAPLPRKSWSSSDDDGATAATSTSGCDSSGCTSCHRAVQRRAARGPDCWLRSRRSQQDLLLLGAQPRHGMSRDSSCTALTEMRFAERAPPGGSIWDHALLESDDAARLLQQRAAQGGAFVAGGPYWGAWRWNPALATRPAPPPAALQPVASFLPCGASVCSAAPQGDIACALEFEQHGWLLAAAGTAKQVRLYSLANALEQAEEAGGSATCCAPLTAHRAASKLSCLAWSPDDPGMVTVGDYDGVLTQLDLESGHHAAEADGHGGRRIWSVSHSPLRRHLAASASEDGTARLWGSRGLATPAGALSAPGGAPVSGVQLSPHDEHAAVLASADSCAYLFDLRRPAEPLCTLRGHSRGVSSARFLGADRLVTSSVDGTALVWRLEAGGGSNSSARVRVAQRFSGHHNSRNFVGLSVRPGVEASGSEEGFLVAVGSEDGAAYAYSPSWSQPLAAVAVGAPAAGGLCSAVCWQPREAGPACGLPLLAAAGAGGHVQVLALRGPLGGGAL